MSAAPDPTAAARAAKAHGRPVVGFLSNNVPVELIHAAGCFPLQLPAVWGTATPLADHYMEQGFDPMARSVFERSLRGDFDFVDLVVLPRTVDSFQRLYYYLCEVRRLGAKVPEAWLYDLLHTPWYSSAEYNYASTLELKLKLEALTGRAVSDAELRASIGLYNRLRGKLAAASELRRGVPCRLAGADALDLFTASQLMMPEAFEVELDAFMGRTHASVPGKRIVLIGSAHDQPVLHALIARAGGQVVGDYHARGELLYGPAIDQDVAPLRALCSHYHRDSLSPRTFPWPVEQLAEFVSISKAEAAIFYYSTEEDVLTWDHGACKRALDAQGVPSLCLSLQPYPVSDAVEPAVREFLRTV